MIAAGADALVIPKGNSAGEIRAVDDQVARTEVDSGRPPGSVRLLPLIETALGVLNAYAIATACPRVDALLLGHASATGRSFARAARSSSPPGPPAETRSTRYS